MSNDEKARLLLQQVIANAADQGRYDSRRDKYPLLTELGLLPTKIENILIDTGHSVIHSLAFRMATYRDEKLFHRWEQLLTQASERDGWADEYERLSSESDHWAIKWDKFHQFLWMLQCCEYFVDEGAKVSFSEETKKPKPDMYVSYADGSYLYAECTQFTKWWATEQLIEEVLLFLDKDLEIRRMHNLPYSDNPFAVKKDADNQDKVVVDVLAKLYEHLKTDNLLLLKQQAQIETPVEVCTLGDFIVQLNGSGSYSGQYSAHGDPAFSWAKFRTEILDSKADSNGLAKNRPNLLMVNCLGTDFQASLNEQSEVCSLPSSLDEVWFCACGVDQRLVDAPRREERRQGR